ncbi:MAG: tyrosine--tRNA ligase [Candidatus Kaiserbacteria bacterium]|nr:tyrosine--tRNA ligase [Candidatus Kaiserbacteria bacterium]
MKLSEVLKERGYAYQQSSETLEEITDGAKRTVYLGIDPSADSLHIGNLMGLLVLRRFLEDGHKVILLTGGGTGMIGDPGGKSEERNLLDEETIKRNSTAVAAQIRKVFGTDDFTEVNNAAWLSKLSLLEFLRDIGKHFTVNSMIKKDIVHDRLAKESPISFTEFSYSLLQGYDYLHLNQEYGCDLQVGGSDQWSNILAGVEFIRRKTEKTVYALTWPLIVNKSTGKKFGKSESGAIWLDPKKTTPFEMYQFLLNSEDDVVEEYLLKLTLLNWSDIEAIMLGHKTDPSKRLAQRSLAIEVVTIVHGADAAHRAQLVTEALFGDAEISEEGWSAIATDAPSRKIAVGSPLIDAIIESGLAESKTQARQFLSSGAIYLNGESLSDEKRLFEESDFSKGAAILKRGKRNISVLVKE